MLIISFRFLKEMSSIVSVSCTWYLNNYNSGVSDKITSHSNKMANSNHEKSLLGVLACVLELNSHSKSHMVCWLFFFYVQY